MKNYPITTETERLLIRPLLQEDIKKWEVFFQSPSSLLYFPPFLTGNAQKDAKFWIDKQLVRYKENRFGLHALIEKESSNFVGQCGLLAQEIDGKTEIEIGYSLLPHFEGKGYATEAAIFFKNYAFKNNLADSVISIIHRDNIGSQNVARKNGMKIWKETNFHGIEMFVFRVAK